MDETPKKKVEFYKIDTTIPQFDPYYEGKFVLDSNNNLYLGLSNRWRKFVFEDDIVTTT